MNKRTTLQEEPDETGDEHKADEVKDSSVNLPVLGTVLMSLATLPKAFEQHPRGAATVALLSILGMLTWVTVTWIQYH
jgi:hypothetical protein